MQRKCHICDSLYTPINRARLEKAFEQTGHVNHVKSNEKKATGKESKNGNTQCYIWRKKEN